MSCQITYNGQILDQVRITEYRIENPASHDNPSTGILRHYLSGEALIYKKEDANSTMDLWKFRLTEYLNTPRKPLKIEMIDAEGSSWVAIDTTGGAYTTHDEQYGPFIRANVTEITGTNAAMVNFTIEFAYSGDSLNRIRSFYCATTFTIDEVGRTTIRKVGSLQMAAFDGPSPRNPAPRNDNRAQGWGTDSRSDVVTDFVTSNGVGGFYPDLFRRFISGNMYRGFRRMRQEYAQDESRTRLLFDITDQEFTRSLPAPARVGDCHFTFERELSGTNAIGIKHFIATVEGDRGVTSGALLTLCIRLSQNRIDYVNDVILKIRVTESGMLSKNEITFEVIANATSTQTFNAVADPDSPSKGNGSLIDQSLLLKNILSPITLQGGTFEFVPAFQPDAYGGALIVRVTPGAFSHKDLPAFGSQYPIGASTTILESQDPVVYQFPAAYFDGVVGQESPDSIGNIYIPKGSPAVPTGPNKGDLQKNTKDSNPTPNLQSKGGRKIKVNSNIVLVPGISPDAKPVIFQVGSPVVEVTEFLDGAKKNESPSRVFSEKSAGSVVASLGYSLSSGTPDLNGNRVLSAAFDRTVLITAAGDFDAGGTSVSQPGFKQVTDSFNEQPVTLVVFNPAEADLVLPKDETQGEASGFNQPNYTVGTEETYLA